MKKIVLLACVAFAALVVLPGCNAFRQMQGGMRKVKAKYKPDGKKMLILPFSGLVFDHFESADGSIIANHAGDYIRKHKITPVQYEGLFLPEKVQKVRAAFDKHKANRPEALKAVAELTDAELVLIGEIDQLESDDPGAISVAKGLLVISVRLYDITEDPKIVWHVNRHAIRYPEGSPYQWDPDAMDLSPEELTQRMLKKAGTNIGKAFHNHLERIR